MRIFKIGGKLAQEIGYTENQKVVFYTLLEEKDKDKCPHCQKTLNLVHDIVEGCKIWDDDVKPVDTV